MDLRKEFVYFVGGIVGFIVASLVTPFELTIVNFVSFFITYMFLLFVASRL